jgi:hypothetical protein
VDIKKPSKEDKNPKEEKEKEVGNESRARL